MLGIVHHGDRDPGGYETWRGNGVVGGLLGTVRNLDDIDVVAEDLPVELLDSPVELLDQLQGSFQMAAASDGRVILATDRLGSRPAYYLEDSEPAVAPSASALAPEIEDPTPDVRAVQEVVSYQVVQGEKTLLEEMSAVPAGSYLVLDDDGVTVERYDEPAWESDFTDYTQDVFDTYRDVVEADSDTVDENTRVGSWLSGGLDSRLLAGLVSQVVPDMKAFTYDSNPGGSVNIEPAKATAACFGAAHEITTEGPEAFAEALEDGIDSTGGRLSWRHMDNLPFRVSDIADRVDVLFEASGQGELFGESYSPEDLERATESMMPAVAAAESLRALPREEVEGLFTEPLDLTQEFRNQAAASPYEDDRKLFIDVFNRAFYPNFHYRTTLERGRVALRHPMVDSRLLDLSAEMPDTLRLSEKYPLLLNLAREPVAGLKLKLIRMLNNGVEDIPYERTKIAPRHPMAVHAARAVIDRLPAFLKQKKTGSGSCTKYDTWYRENEALREAVDGYVEDAKQRDYFNAEEIGRLREAHLDGRENNVEILAAVTTTEVWLQRNT